MISIWTIIFSVITLILSLIFPVLLAIWFCRKYAVRFGTVLAGAVTFFVMQMLIRIPLLQLFEKAYPAQRFFAAGGMPLFLYSLFLASTAALFEEGGRMIFFKLLIKRRGDWKNATAFGIGHGGIESVLLVGITYVVNLILMMTLYTNNGGILEGEMASLLGPSITALTSTPPHMFLAAGVERLMTLVFHTGLSVLVVYGIVARKVRYVLLAFIFHTILNLPVVYFQTMPNGTWLAQIYILIFAAAALIWIIKSKKVFPGEVSNTIEQVKG